MKKQVLIILIISLFIGELSYSQTTLEAVTQTLNGKKWLNKSILNKTYPLNSISKAKFNNGKSKEIIKLDIPEGTYNIFFRVTVLDIKSKYQFPAQETFFATAFEKKGDGNLYKPTNSLFDFFIFQFSGDAESFLKDEKYNNNYFKLNTNSFWDKISVKGNNYWIGLRNPNTFDGIKIILEVVAQGYY
ncbi:MAG: hypothetical protein HXX18_12345 [Bacteroidetes bacterium]|nr:hypothetical protein [Bacteroidota bacterium]